MLEGTLNDLRNIGAGKTRFYASTPEQKQRLDAYRAVWQDMPHHRLPYLYAADAAFMWIEPSELPSDPAVMDEMHVVIKAIGGLFSPKPLN